MRRYAKRNSANNASIPMSMPALSSPVRHDDPPESEFTQDAITDPAPATQEVAEIAGGYPQVPSSCRLAAVMLDHPFQQCVRCVLHTIAQ